MPQSHIVCMHPHRHRQTDTHKYTYILNLYIVVFHAIGYFVGMLTLMYFLSHIQTSYIWSGCALYKVLCTWLLYKALGRYSSYEDCIFKLIMYFLKYCKCTCNGCMLLCNYYNPFHYNNLSVILTEAYTAVVTFWLITFYEHLYVLLESFY